MTSQILFQINWQEKARSMQQKREKSQKNSKPRLFLFNQSNYSILPRAQKRYHGSIPDIALFFKYDTISQKTGIQWLKSMYIGRIWKQKSLATVLRVQSELQVLLRLLIVDSFYKFLINSPILVVNGGYLLRPAQGHQDSQLLDHVVAPFREIHNSFIVLSTLHLILQCTLCHILNITPELLADVIQLQDLIQLLFKVLSAIKLPLSEQFLWKF